MRRVCSLALCLSLAAVVCPSTGSAQSSETVIAWEDLEETAGVSAREFNNSFALDVHPGEPNGYAAVPAEGTDLELANGFGARSWVGRRTGEVLDDDFYGLLGVGTVVRLPENWIVVFGIRCKDGTLTIGVDGITFSADATVER